MKIIIIIQTLIIIAGGYYVYLLTNEKSEVIVETPVENKEVETAAKREGYEPPTENPPSNIAEEVVETEITGHNDVGMEYPIMDMPQSR